MSLLKERDSIVDLRESDAALNTLRFGLDKRIALRAILVGVVSLLLGLAFPLVVKSSYYQELALSGVILGIMGLAIAFLAYRSGLVSLGHTAFYGMAGYVVAITVSRWGFSPIEAAAAGVAAGTLLAVVIGALVVKSPGMSFVMLTLAFGQAFYQLVILDSVRSVTGGYDGLTVTFGAGQKFLWLSQSNMGNAGSFWPLAWTIAVVCAVGLWLIGRSKLGILLEAIRENEERARFSGFNTYGPRLTAFAVSGLVASLAGVLFVMNGAFASPDMFSFGTAGYSLTATVVGGLTTVVGPLLGAILYIYAQAEFAQAGNLQLYTGLALIIVLVFVPGGITGGLMRLAHFVRTRLPGGRR